MSILFIHLINAEFASRDEGAQYENAEAALTQGVQSAVVLVSEEIIQGKCNAALEVSVERENGAQVLRSIVSISVSQLLPVLVAS